MSTFTSITSLLSKFPIAQIASWVPTIGRIVARGISINSIKEDLQEPKVQSEIPGVGSVVSFLEGIGALSFPGVNPDLQAAAGAAVVSKDYAMKAQKLLNLVQKPTPPLEVDGYYGEKTKAAASAYQTAKKLVVDGFVGDATMAALVADAAPTPTTSK